MHESGSAAFAYSRVIIRELIWNEIGMGSNEKSGAMQFTLPKIHGTGTECLVMNTQVAKAPRIQTALKMHKLLHILFAWIRLADSFSIYPRSERCWCCCTPFIQIQAEKLPLPSRTPYIHHVVLQAAPGPDRNWLVEHTSRSHYHPLYGGKAIGNCNFSSCHNNHNAMKSGSWPGGACTIAVHQRREFATALSCFQHPSSSVSHLLRQHHYSEDRTDTSTIHNLPRILSISA